MIATEISCLTVKVVVATPVATGLGAVLSTVTPYVPSRSVLTVPDTSVHADARLGYVTATDCPPVELAVLETDCQAEPAPPGLFTVTLNV